MKRVTMAFAALGLALFALVGLAAPSQAASTGIIHNPLSLCPLKPPVPEMPGQGLAGVFMPFPTQPQYLLQEVNADGTPVTSADPQYLLEEGGTAGMEPITYDLGCSLDPTSYGEQVGANTGSMIQSLVLSPSWAITMLGNALDQQAWNPSWIPSLLGKMSQQVVQAVSLHILLPFLGLGMVLTTIMILRKARVGDVHGVAQAVAWSLLAVTVGALVIVAPTWASTTTQSGLSSVTSSLYGRNQDPASAVTDQILYEVHYQGWLRRTFGSATSVTARTYGPRILADVRFTWREDLETDPSFATTKADRQQRVEARAALVKKKQADFKAMAADIKSSDPDAYTWLTGQHGTNGVALFETGFAIACSFFRIAAAMLLIICVLMLCIWGLAWLVTLPLLVTPPGQAVGRTLLNNSGQCVGYAFMAGLGSWLFSLYTSIVMQPGWPTWWSLVLMFIGTIIGWTVLRPDRKALSMLSGGRVDGTGGTMRFIRRMLGAALTGWTAGKVAAKTVEHEHHDEFDPGAWPDYSRPYTVDASAYDLPRPRPESTAGGLPSGQGEVYGVPRETPGLPGTNAYFDPAEDGAPPSPPVDPVTGEDLYVDNSGHDVVSEDGEFFDPAEGSE